HQHNYTSQRRPPPPLTSSLSFTIPRHPTSTLFPYTTLFRSSHQARNSLVHSTFHGRANDIPSTEFFQSREHSHCHQGRRGLKKLDRKSTRLNSSHGSISYAVFCLKKKKKNYNSDSKYRMTYY